MASPSTFAGSSGLQPASTNPGYNWIVAVRAFAYSVDVDAVCVPSVVISFPVIFPRVMQRGLGFSVLFPAFFTAAFLLTLPRPFVVFSGSVRCLLLSTKGVCLPSRLPRFPSFFFCSIHTRLLPVSGRRIVVARTNRFLLSLTSRFCFSCVFFSVFFSRSSSSVYVFYRTSLSPPAFFCAATNVGVRLPILHMCSFLPPSSFFFSFSFLFLVRVFFPRFPSVFSLLPPLLLG